MESARIGKLVDQGIKVAADYVRIKFAQSARRAEKEGIESPIPLETELTEQTNHDHEVVQAEAVSPKSPEAKLGTACLDCVNDHLDTIGGALSEAVRFARTGDMAEAKRRIAIARQEVNICERIDLHPSVIPGLNREQRDIAHWVLPKFRDMRHSFQSLGSVEGFESASAKVEAVRAEFDTKMEGCVPCHQRAKKLTEALAKKKAAPCDTPECQEVNKLWQKVKGGENG